MVKAVLGGEWYSKTPKRNLCARVCYGDPTGLFLVLDEAQRATSFIFAWPVEDSTVGNNSVEISIIVFKKKLEF